MYRFDDKREPVIAGRRYAVGDEIDGKALDLAVRFGFKVVGVALERAIEELPGQLEQAEDWAKRSYSEIKRAAEAAGYAGESMAKGALLEFLSALDRGE